MLVNSSTPEAPYGGRLMFTRSWEDPACDLQALHMTRGSSVFAITSGGDNVLEFLLADPKRVIAVDLNPTQNYLFELKRAGFLALEHAQFLELLGVREPAGALEHFERCKAHLSPQAVNYWNSKRAWIAAGLLVQGGFEQYFAVLRRVLRVLVGERRLNKLFTLEAKQQKVFFEQEWNTRRYRWALALLCSKWFLGKRLDPSWFAHTDANAFGNHFVGLARHAVATLPARENYFLAQILLGRYLNEQCVPNYLKAENFSLIRERIRRVELRTLDVLAALEQLPRAHVDCFALSNVFEYAPESLFDACKSELLRVAAPNAHFCLRNLVAPRVLASDPRFVVDEALSERLRAADRGFIYRRFEAARRTSDA